MAGVALGRLWDSNPRIAFVLHVITCSLIGLVALVFWLQTSWGTATILTILFLVDAAALVLCTMDAAGRDWTRNTEI
jgi:hypothetical protein